MVVLRAVQPPALDDGVDEKIILLIHPRAPPGPLEIALESLKTRFGHQTARRRYDPAEPRPPSSQESALQSATDGMSSSARRTIGSRQDALQHI